MALSWILVASPIPAAAQSQAFTPADSALIGRILHAEDRRDPSSLALDEGARHPDVRIRLLAWRAAARVRDPVFAARDSLPEPATPPTYADPAWRLRYRALADKGSDCAAVRGALADSSWHVRLRAADVAAASCAADTALVSTLREWADTPPSSGARRAGEPGWHSAAHALLALARLAPEETRKLLPRYVASPVPWLRLYAARAAAALDDAATLRRLARDGDDNVKEAAVDALAQATGHADDAAFLSALSSRGYQAVRAGARALEGSPRRAEVPSAALAAARRLRGDSSETSRDARLALLERIDELADSAAAADVAALATDFDCDVARAAAGTARRLGAADVPPQGHCTPLPIKTPPAAVTLALGQDVRLRVALADSSGGGSFTVRLRGDVAPIMAARVLALARSGYYDGTVWQRVQPDFVLQGGGPGASEYIGHPRYIRDELSTLPHVRGTVGMSTRGHDTGDAQWFVNLRDNLRLTRDYTVFAEVVDGLDIVDGILEGDVIDRIEVLARRE